MKQHGESGARRTPEYRAWQSMQERCYCPRNKRWKRYGKRGIRVCARWRHSYENFLADMGRRPGPGYSLDRRENDGNYAKSNCRWATHKTQGRNRSNNRVVSFRGRKMPLSAAAELAGCDYGLVKLRVHRGWSVARALREPARRAA